jgi:hypothetical protein
MRQIAREAGFTHISETLAQVFITPNESDRNMEPANIVDGLFILARSNFRLAAAIDRLAETGGEQ